MTLATGETADDGAQSILRERRTKVAVVPCKILERREWHLADRNRTAPVKVGEHGDVMLRRCSCQLGHRFTWRVEQGISEVRDDKFLQPFNAATAQVRGKAGRAVA